MKMCLIKNKVNFCWIFRFLILTTKIGGCPKKEFPTKQSFSNYFGIPKLSTNSFCYVVINLSKLIFKIISFEIALYSHHKNKISQLFNIYSTLIQPPCRPVAHLCFALPRLAGPIFSHYFTTAYCCCCYCAFGVILHPVFT